MRKSLLILAFAIGAGLAVPTAATSAPANGTPLAQAAHELGAIENATYRGYRGYRRYGHYRPYRHYGYRHYGYYRPYRYYRPYYGYHRPYGYYRPYYGYGPRFSFGFGY